MNKKKLVKFLTLIALFLDHQAFAFEEKKIIDFSTETFELKNFVYDKNSNALKTHLFGKIRPVNHDFKIDFDSSVQEINSETMFLGEGFIKQGGHFITSQNALYYSNLRGRFFNAFPDVGVGDFTIEFRVLFHDLSGMHSIVERVGFVIDAYNDKVIKHGFKFFLLGGKLQVDFYNLFHFKQQRKTFKVIYDDSFREDRWYHIAVTYDDDRGTLSLYLEGKRKKVIRTTEDKKWGSRQYYPGFLPEIETPLILGKKMQGRLDEIYFYSIKKEQFLVEKYPAMSSEFTSKVLTLPLYSKLHQVHVTGNFDERLMKVYIRNDSNYFLPQDNERDGLFWKRVYINKPLFFRKTFKRTYVQFRILLNNHNSNSPIEIQRVSIESIKNPPPATPIIKYLTPLTGGFEVAWVKSSESDLAGYHIDYFLVRGNEDASERELFKNNSITLFKKDLEKNQNDDLNVFVYEVRGIMPNEKYQVSIKAFDEMSESHNSIPTKLREIIPF